MCCYASIMYKKAIVFVKEKQIYKQLMSRRQKQRWSEGKVWKFSTHAKCKRER